jgi:AraC-like DNA-binding protein
MRYTYETERDGIIAGLPEFVMLGSESLRTTLGLQEHDHPGCYEFVWIEKGQAVWEINGSTYETVSGQLFHSRPGERHRGNRDVIEPSKFWWLIIKAPDKDGWLGLDARDVGAVSAELRALPRVVNAGFRARDIFARMKDGLQQGGPLRNIMIRQSILELLLLAVRPGVKAPGVADDLQRKLHELVARMENEPAWRPAIAELAAYCLVSPTHFHRAFQRHTGLTPVAYMDRVRVDEACALLSRPQATVTGVAHDLGYSSSQNFATSFKKYTGLTPTAWRAQQAAPSGEVKLR